MNTFYTTERSGWTRTRLKFLMEGCQNGAWGSEAGADERDVVCVRVADFDWSRLAVKLTDPTVRSFTHSQVQKLSLRPGDLLLEKSGGGEKTPVGRVVAFESSELAVTSNFVARIRPTDRASGRFLLYLLAAQYMSGFAGQFVKQNTGIQNLDDTSWFSTDAVLPELVHQNAIADFLDREIALVDQLIEKKQRLIKVYGEREEAGFHQAVTGKSIKGPTSDSGVDWIGDMPSHWLAPKFVHVAKQETGHTPSRKEDAYWVPEECTIPWVSLADVWQLRDGTAVYINDTSEKISPLGMANSAARLLPAQTVILSRTASVGFAGILAVSMATTQDFVGWICSSNVRPKYMYFVLRAMKSVFRRLMMGSTHQTIYMPDIRSFRLPLPPIQEQDAIIAELEQAVGTFRATTAKLQTSVDKLREFRSALITAAVTGQIDVTTWGKQGQTSRRLDKIQEEMGA